MKIIVIGGGKGGLSKTTTAINIAVELSINNKVLVLDCDVQKQIIKFNNNRENSKLEVKVIQSEKELEDATIKHENYDYIIIDLPSGYSNFNTTVMSISDLVIMPVTDSDNDFSEIFNLIHTLEKKSLKGNDFTEIKLLPVRVNWNSTAFQKALKDHFKDSEKTSVFETQMIQHKKSYDTMITSGLSAKEKNVSDTVSKNISDLRKEIIDE